MSKQLIAPNLKTKGTPGLCLVYVRNIFSAPPKYVTAALGWANAKYKHTGNPPTDVSVPVWFKWGTSGHVAVNVPGKGVYSTTAKGDQVFSSVQALAKYIGGTYLGFSEDVDGVRVVEYSTAPTSAPKTSSFRVTPGHTFHVYKPGSTTALGVIDNSWGWYIIRGADPKYPNRWLAHSAKLGDFAFPWANTSMQAYTGQYETK